MIYTNDTIKQVRNASDVKHALREDNHFFNRSTMRFFGDTLASFGVRTVNGKRYIYRKPTAKVNAFGKWKTAGREFFSAWEIVPKHDHVELRHVDKSEKEKVYQSI